MHWWQGAFSSSSKRHSDDDSVIVAESRYSVKGGFFSGRRIRNHGRSRKVRYVSEKDVDPWRSLSRSELSASARSSAAVTPSKPQPLPMPELHVLLRNDPKFASPSLPLPSSRGANQNQRGAYDDRERDRERQTAETSGDDDLDRHNGLRRISRLVNPQTNVEQAETQPCRCKSSGQKQTPKARSPYGYRISIPISAPTSPYSSPALSPLGCDMMASHYMTPPSVFHVWSAPEIPYSSHTCFYNQTPFEKISSSVDSSPLHSPTVGPALPLPGLLSPESRREGGSCGVHPLPRPPGTAASQPSPKESLSPAASSRLDFSGAAELDFLGSNIPPQLLPIAQVAGKPKVMPIKSKWRKGKLIGRGTYGSVYVASNRETGALCAMKEVEILPDDSNSAERMRQLEQEIKVLSHLKHPNIVQYFGSEIVRDKFYIYLEYVHPGSINKFIQDHCGAITEPIVRNFTRHILCGLAYLHSTKTIHRDIKGANLLVDAYGVVKLADFGMAKHLNGEAANLSLKGSPYWLAPELLQSVVSKDASTDVALAVDIWSLGCTIIEMMDGKPPWSEYEGAAALFKVLQEIPPIPETLSADGKDFLQCCFRRNPAERPTATKLLDHPFVNYSSTHLPNASS